MKVRWFVVAAALAAALSSPTMARAQQATATPTPQPLSDAWWTGPMLAASASTLPHGHLYFEPYIFDVRSGNTNAYGSLTYMLYGITDRFTFGIQPTFGYNAVRGAPSSSGVGVGDLTAIAQYGITRFHTD